MPSRPRDGVVITRVIHRVPFRIVAFIGSLALLGCQADEITRYRAPRSDEPAANKPAVRLLAAIFAQGETSWVFKLQGPEADIAERVDSFTRLIRSVKFADKADP